MSSSWPYDRLLLPVEIDRGAHRRMVGGRWDEIGVLQFEHVVANGLAPGMRFLDVGCGSLRGGVHFVAYLHPGGYYGLDLNASLLDAGYDVELARAGLQHKLPRNQLIANGTFDVARFGVTFDMALAHSLFTHLPIGEVRQCLSAVAGVLAPGGRLLATFFECPPDHPADEPYTHQPGGEVTFRDRNPWHYRPDELVGAVDGLPLTVVGWTQWGHPRAQRMMTFER